MKIVILFAIFATIQCRPQNWEHDEAVSEAEKHEKATKDILQKIAEVNKMHGLVPEKKKPNYFHFPFSYSRQQEDSKKMNIDSDVYDEVIDDINEGNQSIDEDNQNINEDNQDVDVEPQITKKITHVQTFGVPINVPMQQQMPYYQQENTNQNMDTNFKQYLEQTDGLPIKKQTIIKHEIYPVYPQQNMNQQYYPGVQNNNQQSRQNWNWPGAQYFPIIIRDPFIQMYNAITTMIEYGPGVMGGGNSCKGKNKDGRTPKNVENVEETTWDMEDIHIGTLKPIQNRKSRENNDELLAKRNNFFTAISKSNTTMYVRNRNDKLPKNDTLMSPPPRDPPLDYEDDLTDDEGVKSDDITLSNENSKKVFSKDNTGSGIFIHKLKVRKGGVAIAGPGGIATAGSGGTAIVGPNGYAYTHPDSLAIAGSGSKVIALDPSVSLVDAINSHNGTRKGKVVATGPVIYYNRG